MKLLNSLVTCLFLPFAFIACDNKEVEGGEEGVAVSKDTHEIIYTEYYAMMEEVMGSMGGIQDKESAEAFLVNTTEMAPELEAILNRAKSLPEPSEEEKMAAQSAHSEVMARIRTIQKENLQINLNRDLTPEAKAAIGAVREKVMKGEFGKQMALVSRQMDAIYGLKN